MKLLLYCTKAKPYLVKRNIFAGVEPSYFTLKENVDDSLNGKIVAECDFEVEEIKNKLINNNSHLELFTDSLTENKLFEESCITRYEMFYYLKNDFTKKGEPKGYAIHIKNLHIFDEPKELKQLETCDYKTIKKAPQNMMKCMVLKNDEHYDEYILISIQPQWLCKILNGEKTIEVRKKVLKGMIK